MDITFFKSKDCPQCPRAQANVEATIAELGISDVITYIDISTTEGRIEALNNMVMGTPSLMVDGEVYPKDDLLDKERLKGIFSK